MFHNRTRLVCALALSTSMGATTIAPAHAATAEPACKPVLDAMQKLSVTPHRNTTTTTAAYTHGKPETGEMIQTGSAIYVEIKGKWRRSPATPQELQQQTQENLRNAKSYDCRFLRDESVNGETAALYSTQTATEDARENGQAWISKSRGLPLKQELDMDVGGAGGKIHRSIRYDYDNVQPPTT
jgi:hypothetical protein